MQRCDTLLMVGSSFPYAEFLPEEGHARGVQIDIDGRMLEPALPDGSRTSSATARATLRALLPLPEPPGRPQLARDASSATSRAGGRCSKRAR